MGSFLKALESNGPVLFHRNKMPEGMRKDMRSLDSTVMKSTLRVKGYDPNDRAEPWTR